MGNANVAYKKGKCTALILLLLYQLLLFPSATYWSMIYIGGVFDMLDREAPLKISIPKKMFNVKKHEHTGLRCFECYFLYLFCPNKPLFGNIEW